MENEQNTACCALALISSVLFESHSPEPDNTEAYSRFDTEA